MDIFFDGVHLPFKDISFDNIIALEVLEHVEELDDLILRLIGLLKKMVFLLPQFHLDGQSMKNLLILEDLLHLE